MTCGRGANPQHADPLPVLECGSRAWPRRLGVQIKPAAGLRVSRSSPSARPAARFRPNSARTAAKPKFILKRLDLPRRSRLGQISGRAAAAPQKPSLSAIRDERFA